MTLAPSLLSYGVAAVGFLILTLLLAVSWEGRTQGVRLIVACAVTTAWAALFAAAAGVIVLSLPLLLLAELLRYGAWFVVLTGLTAKGHVAHALSRTVHVVWIAGAVGVLAIPLLMRAGVTPRQLAHVWAQGGLLLALLGLVLLEQLVRNTREEGRYALRYFAIAVGVMFAYDLFMYSQALLLRDLDLASWTARGIVMLLTVPMIALAARRNPQWSLNVFVSRHVVFYTTSFIALGAYLLLMALGGYLINLYGGTWGDAARLVFFAGAGVVLLLLVASGVVRRRLRVFLSKHFYRNKYDYRVEWLRFIGTLSAPEHGVDPRENAVRAIAQLIGSPGGVLFMRRDDTGEYKASAAWPPGDFTEVRRFPLLAPTDDLVSFMQRALWVVDLREVQASPDVYRNMELPPLLRSTARYRLVVPLAHIEELIGFVLLSSPPEPFHPNYEDHDLLKTVGRHVAVHLAQIEADKQLSESRQFEAYHRLTAFVMHDLKNLAAQLALIVSNADRHRRNPEFVDDAISTIANSTMRMQRLIEQLQRREMHSTKRRVRLLDVARQAVQRCQVKQPRPTLAEQRTDVWIEADPDRLAMVIEHVIRNAQEATPESGTVTVHVDIEGGVATAETLDTSRLRVPAAVVTVADTGVGMSRDFIQERLFKPFDTTKGSKGMGIGAYQVREYVRSLGGRVEVRSDVGRGTRFTLRVPLALPGEDEVPAELQPEAY